MRLGDMAYTLTGVDLDPEALRYRVEVSLVQHSQIARRCLPELLTTSDAEFDWSR